jgi:hypothetical protein
VVDRPGARSDYAFLLDFKAVYPVIVSAIEASQKPDQAPNPLGVEPLNVVKALGLDALGSLSISGGLAADGSTIGDAVLTYSEDRGIVKLLAYRDGPVVKPDWVPATWLNVSTQNFSISDLYAEIEATLDRISPMLAGLAMGQIRAFDRRLNIDLRRDLIGNFGPVLLSGIALPAGASAATPPPYDEMDQLFAVSLADAPAFERTLDAIKSQFFPAEGGPLEKRDYLGRTLYVFTPPAGSPPGMRGIGYAVADGWLLVGVGTPASIEAVIQRLNKPDAVTSFWARTDVRAALEPVPVSSSSVQFSELTTMFASLCALAVKAQAARGDEAPVFVDASAVPNVEVFARHLSCVLNYGERRPDGLYFHTFMPAAPAR